ncbi:hypothetical protein, partial [Xenorhabdus nematophila]|uniref:hypothetical protein n=1 Tax=Xenorhabdus nematophila TaxID=628 RepID=UPI003D6F31B2
TVEHVKSGAKFQMAGRFIPVLTGNTQYGVIGSRKGTVYPRTYGEHLINHKSHHLGGGLSPYLRGTLPINRDP